MKNDLNIFPPPSLRLLLLTALNMITLSPLSPAAPLMEGDEYGGGKVVYIFQPGDQDFAESADQAVIVAKADVSATISWSDTRTSTDKLEGIGSHERRVPGRARQARLARVTPDFRQ